MTGNATEAHLRLMDVLAQYMHDKSSSGIVQEWCTDGYSIWYRPYQTSKKRRPVKKRELITHGYFAYQPICPITFKTYLGYWQHVLAPELHRICVEQDNSAYALLLYQPRSQPIANYLKEVPLAPGAQTVLYSQLPMVYHSKQFKGMLYVSNELVPPSYYRPGRLRRLQNYGVKWWREDKIAVGRKVP